MISNRSVFLTLCISFSLYSMDTMYDQQALASAQSNLQHLFSYKQEVLHLLPAIAIKNTNENPPVEVLASIYLELELMEINKWIDADVVHFVELFENTKTEGENVYSAQAKLLTLTRMPPALASLVSPRALSLSVEACIKEGASLVNPLGAEMEDAVLSPSTYPIHFAALYGACPPIMNALLKNGDNINRKTATNETPLLYALEMENAPLAFYLLQKNASPYGSTNDGRTTIGAALRWCLHKRSNNNGGSVLEDLLRHFNPAVNALVRRILQAARVPSDSELRDQLNQSQKVFDNC